MKRLTIVSAILLFEILGFSLVVAIIWIDEVLDLPHRLFGAPRTPVNWIEASLESIPVLLLAVVVVCLSLYWLNKIRLLEGLLPICSDCRRIRVGEGWVPLERYIEEHSEAAFTYSLCPACLNHLYGELLHQRAMQRQSAGQINAPSP